MPESTLVAFQMVVYLEPLVVFLERPQLPEERKIFSRILKAILVDQLRRQRQT